VLVIAIREKPSRPWAFVTLHIGPKRKAEESARQIQEQERTLFGHSKAEVRVFTDSQWDRKLTRKPRKKRAPKPKEEGGTLLGIRF